MADLIKESTGSPIIDNPFSNVGTGGKLNLIDSGYALGTNPEEETATSVPANKRSIKITGVPADGEYSFQVVAFRAVDKDIAADGVIRSAPADAPQNPVQPVRVPIIGDNVLVGGTPIGGVVDAIKSPVTGLPINIAALNASLKTDIAAAKLEGTIARLDLATSVTALNLSVATARAEAAQVRTDLVPTIASARQAGLDASAAAALVRSDLVPTISAARQEGTTARSEAAQVKTDLSTEVQRAKDDTAAIRVVTTQLRTDTNGNASAISTETTTRANADSALSNRVDTVTATANTDRSTINARIQTEETTRADAVSAVASRTSTLETKFNDGTTGNLALSTKITDEATTRSSADTGLANRASSLEATVNDASKGNLALQSRIATEETARTTADTTLATRADVLESGVGVTGYSVNPNFSRYPTTVGTPPGWNVNIGTGSDFSRVAGEFGGYAMASTNAANTQNLIQQQSAINSFVGQQWIVIECDVKLVSGNLQGAGMIARVTDATGGTNFSDYLLVLSSDKDITENVIGNGATGNVYRFRKLVQTTRAAASYVQTFVGRWTGFGSVANASNLIFYRANIRPATNAEIAAQRADTNASSALSRITTEETTRATADTSLANRSTALESSVNTGSNSLSALRGSITDNATTAANATTAVANRTTTLESAVNSGTNSLANLRSTINTNETTRSNADTALANRSTALESTVNNGTTGLAAVNTRISSEETTRATADAALASRATSLESTNNSATNNSINANPNFAAWPTGQALPSGWIAWVGSGTVSRTASETSAPGTFSLKFVTAGANENFAIQQSGVFITKGWYVLEAEVYLDSGTYNGAGVTFAGSLNLSFATEPDTNGVISATGPARRKFTKLINANADFNGQNFHPMANWDGFGSARDAKTITFYRCAIRAASDGEIKALKATNDIVTTVARIATEETTRTNADSALANRSTSLESRMGNQEGFANAINAKVDSNATTFTNADAAIATRADSLEARNGGGGNMINNSEFLLTGTTGIADGWRNFAATAVIPQFAINGPTDDWHLPYENALTIFQTGQGGVSGYTGYQSTRFAVQAGGYIQAYCYMASHRCQTEFIIYWVDAAGAILSAWVSGVVGAGTGGVPAGDSTTGGTDINKWRRQGGTNILVPANARGAYFELRKYNTNSGQSDSYAWFTRPYLGIARANTTEWSPYSAGSSASALKASNARIVTEETTRSTADTALANRATTLESAVNTGTNSLTNLRSTINTNDTTRSNADTALANRATALETSVNSGANNLASLRSGINTEATSRTNADTTLANRAASLESQVNLTSGSNMFSRITTEETTRATADSTLANRSTALEARGLSSGNILPNSEVIVSYSGGVVEGWGNFQAPNTTASINPAGKDWHLPGEDNFGFFQSNNAGGTGYSGYQSSRFAITPSGFIQAYCYIASHRCKAELIVFWSNYNNEDLGFWASGAQGGPENGGSNINAYRIQGSTNIQVPANATSAYIELRKYDTLSGSSDSYAWFTRPYCGASRSNTTEWAPYSAGPAKGAITVAHGRISTEETVRANADTGLAFRATSLESRMGNQEGYANAINAKVDSNEATRATTTSALATRSSTLEASVNSVGGSSVRNDRFENWPNKNGPPAYWGTWISDGNYRYIAMPGMGSSNGVQTLNDVNGAQCGFFQALAVHPGKWIIQVTARLDANVLNGAGVTLSGIYNINFASDSDTNGYVSNSGEGKVRSWSKIIDVEVNGVTNFHAMHGWSGFGTSIEPKYMTWFNLSLRPATQGEILGQAGNINATSALARINTEETVRSNADSALASRATSLETRAGGVEARVSTTEGAISTLNGKAAAYWQVSAVAGNNRAQLTVRADANGGGGVDIVGDTTFSGKLAIGTNQTGARTEITNSGTRIYDANGTLRALFGLF